MAWAERTIHTVEPPSDNVNESEEEHINKILKNMPPFIKLSSRRARKTLAKYEEVKQRHIENLRNNPVFKFVMMVSGFTNENMQKYWKGSDVSPFQEGYGPKDIKIDKEEIKLLVRRARERALADLHQFCRPIPAVPMYRSAKDPAGQNVRSFEASSYDYTSSSLSRQSSASDFSGSVSPNRSSNSSNVISSNAKTPVSPNAKTPVSPNAKTPQGNVEWAEADTAKKPIQDMPKRMQAPNARRRLDFSSNATPQSERVNPESNLQGYNNTQIKQESQEESSNMDPPPLSVPVQNSELTTGDSVRGRNNVAQDTGGDKSSRTKYIYNMSDMEFRDFCIFFKSELFSVEKAYSREGQNRIERYILGSRDAQNQPVNFPAHKHQRRSNNEVPEVNDIPEDDGYPNRNHDNQGVDRVFDRTRIYDRYDNQQDSYDHRSPYVSVQRTNWVQWSDNQTIVHWDEETTAGYWFQRYIARWLVKEELFNVDELRNGRPFRDLEPFRNKYGILFNNLFLKDKREWWRDLTGLRLTKMIRSYEGHEGQWDNNEPHNIPTEVPLDFVRPLFNERFAYWKHELVLGEYEKRTMYEADQWLQKTPWAIGKIYLQPNIYSHMQEAHIAISSKFKKFNGLGLQDWLTSEKHMFFYAKLVALCIRTSAVLSNKKYGLDKAYMRLNLEKRRVMYSLSKMEKPKRMPVARLFPRASANQEQLWENYRAARARGDVSEAQRILQTLN